MISRRTNETLAFSPCTFPVYFSMHSSCTQLKRTASKHYERLGVYVIRLHGRRCGNVHGYIRTSIRRIRGFLYGVRARGIHSHEEGLRTICQEAVPGRRSKFQCFFPLVVLFAIFHRERFSTCLFRKKVAVRSSPRRIEAINDRAPNYPFASWSSVRSFKLDSRGNTKPRPILYTRYCVQVIYRLEWDKGKGGYFYLYFSPRLNARLNEEDNFLHSAGTSNCWISPICIQPDKLTCQVLTDLSFRGNFFLPSASASVATNNFRPVRFRE